MARDRLEFPEIRSYISLHDLVETLAGTHGALDVERAHVLPIFLEQRHQEIDGETDIGGQVVRLHGDVAHGDGQAQDLLELKLDGGLQLLDLGDHVVAVSDHRWEFTGFVQARSQNTGNLLDESIGGQESVVLLGELLDQLLVLVHLLQRLLVHAGDAVGGCLITMLLIAEDADGELGSRDMTQLDGT